MASSIRINIKMWIIFLFILVAVIWMYVPGIGLDMLEKPNMLSWTFAFDYYHSDDHNPNICDSFLDFTHQYHKIFLLKQDCTIPSGETICWGGLEFGDDVILQMESNSTFQFVKQIGDQTGDIKLHDLGQVNTGETGIEITHVESCF